MDGAGLEKKRDKEKQRNLPAVALILKSVRPLSTGGWWEWRGGATFTEETLPHEDPRYKNQMLAGALTAALRAPRRQLTDLDWLLKCQTNTKSGGSRVGGGGEGGREATVNILPPPRDFFIPLQGPRRPPPLC